MVSTVVLGNPYAMVHSMVVAVVSTMGLGQRSASGAAESRRRDCDTDESQQESADLGSGHGASFHIEAVTRG